MSVRQTSNSRRIVWLAAVLIVAFASPLISSILYFLSGDQPGKFETLSRESLRLQYIFAIAFELIALGLLALALFKQNRRFKSIGLMFAWKDLPVSIVLTLLVFVVSVVFQAFIFYVYYIVTGRELNSAPQNVGFMKIGISSFSLIFIFINPFYEELIVRAYLMTEIEFLTRSRVIAVIASVVLQTGYHLYQGWPSALVIGAICLTFSLYFVWKKRITPIIMAHLYFDLWALLSYA